MAERTQKIAPLQLLAVAFNNPKFEGKITKELDKLRDNKMLRIVDGLVVYKNRKGEIETRQKSDLSLEDAGAYGAVIGGLIGLGSGDAETAKKSTEDTARAFEERYEYGLDQEDVEEITAAAPKDSALLILLIEHLWATPLRDALRQAGGILMAQDFLSPELLITIGQRKYAGPVQG